MPPLILSAPAPIPEEYVSPWQGLRTVWTGCDGSVWDLTDRSSGVALVMQGLVGLHFPKFARHSSKSRALPGNRLRGWQAEEREVFWPLLIWADGSDGWRDRNNAFMNSLHPADAGTWEVQAGTNAPRSLDLTLVVDDDYAFEVDPLKRGWAGYPVSLEAAQPYWRGEKVTAGPWLAPQVVPFIDPAGSPPFHISSGTTFGAATVSNTGDVPAWGVWRLTGPLSGVEIGVDGAVISLPFSLASGKVLVIDTDPAHPTAVLDGVDATASLGLQDYAAVPPGEAVDLHVEAVGGGQVQFELTPCISAPSERGSRGRRIEVRDLQQGAPVPPAAGRTRSERGARSERDPDG